MKIEDAAEVIGRGVYSVPQAARLVGASPDKLRRWVFGLGGRQPIIIADYPLLNGTRALSFHDLIEARFIRAFIEADLTFHHLRRVAQKARREFKIGHPFASERFVTDGRRIMLEQREADGGDGLTDYLSDQKMFADFLRRTVLPGVGFDASELADQWRPWTDLPSIILDPARAWGHPIVERTSTPTEVIASAVKAEGSVERAASAYDLRPTEVKQAVEAEMRLNG